MCSYEKSVPKFYSKLLKKHMRWRTIVVKGRTFWSVILQKLFSIADAFYVIWYEISEHFFHNNTSVGFPCNYHILKLHSKKLLLKFGIKLLKKHMPWRSIFFKYTFCQLIEKPPQLTTMLCVKTKSTKLVN